MRCGFGKGLNIFFVAGRILRRRLLTVLPSSGPPYKTRVIYKVSLSVADNISIEGRAQAVYKRFTSGYTRWPNDGIQLCLATYHGIKHLLHFQPVVETRAWLLSGSNAVCEAMSQIGKNEFGHVPSLIRWFKAASKPLRDR